MFKKLLTLTLGVWLLLMLCGSALAAEPIINQQQAMDAAKKLLPEIIGDKQLAADYRDDDYRGTGVWALRTQSDRPLRGGPPDEIGIEINAANGSLIGLYYYNSKETTGGRQLVDRNQAREIAYNFLKRVQPGILNQIKLDDNSRSSYYYGDSSLNLTYSFHWSRLVNGIPVQDDGIYVNVDAVSAKITHFNANWHESVTFPTPANNLIKPEELTNLVVEKLGLYPTYSINPYTASNQKAQLVYKVNGNASFDGVTGKPVSYDGSIKEFSEGKLFNQEFTPEIGGREIPAASQSTGQISPVKAQSIAEEFFKNMGYSGKVIRAGSGSESGPGYRIDYWDYQIETGEGDKFSDYPNMSVSIDSSSGRIAGFNTGPERIIDKSNKPISYQQARVSAEQFVEKLGISYPMIMQQDDNLLRAGEPYRFNFVYLLHGVPCDLSGIYVGIDRYSGKVVDFHSRVMTASIPKIEQIISPDEATKIFKENQPFELAYTFSRDKNFRPQGNAQLVYVLKNFGQGIDAVTGKVLSGEDVSDARPTFNNHWAQEPLRLLAESGLLPEKDFDPDSKITRREALRILNSINHYYDDNIFSLNFSDIQPNDKDNQYFKRAIEMGILENQGLLKPDEPLSREQLAVWLVNGIGYQEVANLPLKMEAPFKDIPINHPYRNHIALISALGIFVGDKDGLFHPQQPVSWAELASVVTRIAPKMGQRY